MRARAREQTRERFSDDTGTLALSLLAVTAWQLGEVERPRELIDQANERAKDIGHAPSMAHPLVWKSYLEMLRGDAGAALSAAEALESLSREHGMPFWRVRAQFNMGWATAASMPSRPRTVMAGRRARDRARRRIAFRS